MKKNKLKNFRIFFIGLCYVGIAGTFLFSPSFLWAQDQEASVITGVVTSDATKKPLQGATVSYKGSKGEDITVRTDSLGRYTIKAPSRASGKISVSHTGQKSRQINLAIDKRPVINIAMEEDQAQLEEVVVATGYQKVDRKLFTGSTVNINFEDVKVGGVTDASKLLEGRAAGVSLQSPSATFGAAPKIRIRGTTSIYGNTTPLFVVDGVVLESVVEINTDDLSSGNANTILSSSIAGLNPDDIVSFQILKDASATSIYGTRAKNGVIVITTRSGGFNQKLSVSYSGTFNIRQKPSYAQYNIMNSQDQMDALIDMYRKGNLNYTNVFSSANSGVFGIMYNKLSTLDANGNFELENNEEAKIAFLSKYAVANTDWFDILFKNSLLQTHSLSFSGGGEKSSFYSSVSYLKDAGQTISDNVDRLTFTLKENMRPHKNVTVGLQFNGSVRNQLTPNAADALSTSVFYGGAPARPFDINPYLYAISTSRTIRAYDENGNLEYVKKNYAPFNILKETAENHANLRALDILTQANVAWTIIPGLKYEFTGSIRYNTSISKQTISEESNYANAYRANDNQTVNDNNIYLYKDPDNATAPGRVVLPVGGFYRQTSNDLFNYYIRNTLNWNKKTKGNLHEINVFAGQELRYIDRSYSFTTTPAVEYANGQNTSNFDPLFYEREKQIGGRVLDLLSSTVVPRDRSLSYFLNLAYNYNKRYTINVTGRYDGSNRLGRSQSARWLPTWNVSGSWDIYNEKFMAKLYDKGILSQLRLRMTYGLTANFGIANNATSILYPIYTYRGLSNTRENAIYIDDLANEDLTWEKQYEYNVGVDAGFLNNKIVFVGDVYFRKGFDVIGYIYTSGIGGQSLKSGNYANTASNGAELSVSFNDLLSKYINHFGWSINLVFSYNQSEVTSLKYSPRIIDLLIGNSLEGRPISALYSVPFVRLDNKGVPVFINEKNRETTSKETVNFQSRENVSFLRYEGPITPTITGGLNNTFRYKGFSLNIFFSLQAGNKVRIPYYPPNDDVQSITTQALNRWTLPGDEFRTNQPTISSGRLEKEYTTTNLTQLYGAYALSQETIADGSFVRLKSVSIDYTFSKKTLKSFFQQITLRFSATNLALFFTDKKLNGLDPEFVNTGGVALPIQPIYTFTINASL